MSVSVLFDAPGPKARARHRLIAVLGAIVALAAVGAIVWKFNKQGQLDGALWKPVVQPDTWVDYIIPGFINTLIAAGLSIVLAIAFGLLFGLGRLSEIAPVRWVSGVIVEFFRAVPVLLMMLFLFGIFGARQSFGDNNALVAVVLALMLYNGSVIAELVRSGVHQLPKGQREAGLSIGLTDSQSLRIVQLPQALTAMLPALVGQLVVALKDTALGTALPYVEMLQQAKNAGTAYGSVIPLYILAAVLFIAINYSLTVLAGRVERRLNKRGRVSGGAATPEPVIVPTPQQLRTGGGPV